MSEFVRQPKAIPLHPAIKEVIDNELTLPYASGEFPDKLNNTIQMAESGGVFQLGEGMANALSYVYEKDSTNTSGSAPTHVTISRVLAVIDQLAWSGSEDDIKQFTANSSVCDLLKQDDLLKTISFRFHNRIIGNYDYLAAHKCSLITFFCANQSTDSEIKNLLTGRAEGFKAESLRKQADQTREEWAKAYPEEAAKQAAEYAEQLRRDYAARQIKAAEALALEKAQRRAERQRRKALEASRQHADENVRLIRNNPAKYPEIVSEMQQAAPVDGELTVEKRLAKYSGAVLDAKQNGVEVPLEIAEKATAELEKLLIDYLQSNEERRVDFSDRAVDLYDLKKYLIDIIPDKAAYARWAAKFSKLRYYGDDGINKEWRDQYIRRKLETEATPDEQLVARQLRKVGISSIDVLSASTSGTDFYVSYDSLADMYSDIRTYFVMGPGGTHTTENIYEASERSGADIDTLAQMALNRFSRTDSEIFQSDVVDGLEKFIAENEIELDLGRQIMYQSPEARHGGTPYKYESTNFGGHAISIGITQDASGSRHYKLIMRGGGYVSETHQGMLIDNFAAFSDREVTCDLDTSGIKIIPNARGEYGEARTVTYGSEELGELFKTIAHNNIEPEVTARDKMYGEINYTHQRREWVLPGRTQKYAKALEALEAFIHGSGTTIESHYHDFDQYNPKSYTPPRSGIESWTVLCETKDYKGGSRVNMIGEVPIPDSTPPHYYLLEDGKKVFIVKTQSLSTFNSLRRIANHMRYR